MPAYIAEQNGFQTTASHRIVGLGPDSDQLTASGVIYHARQNVDSDEEDIIHGSIYLCLFQIALSNINKIYINNVSIMCSRNNLFSFCGVCNL